LPPTTILPAGQRFPDDSLIPTLFSPELKNARSFYIRFAKITLPETRWLFSRLAAGV
jgi:hypothetical protein